MNPNLSEKVALVTGASAGIGRAVALNLANAGVIVIANARRAELLDELRDDAPSATIMPVPGDASDPETIDQMFEASLAVHGRCPEIVVVNAGRGLAGSVLTSDEHAWEEMVRINLLGAARLMRSAARRMVEQFDAKQWPKAGAGDIVVLGSNVGKHISPFSSMYGSTKFGVNALAEGLRREVGPKGIRVTLISPGIVRSEFQAVAGYDTESFGALMKKFDPVLDPEDIARTINFVVSQPPHVNINDIVIRATKQDYP